MTPQQDISFRAILALTFRALHTELPGITFIQSAILELKVFFSFAAFFL